MKQPLQNKTILITGGARRVGAAIGERLHAAGANLVIHYRSSGREARALVKSFNALRQGSAMAIKANLLDRLAPQALVRACVKHYGQLDGLVNNASSFYATPMGSMKHKGWDDLVGTNLKAPLFLSQAAAPALKRTRGVIVNIVDIHAELPLPDYLMYTVAKGGLAALTRSLARELAPEIRVNGVSPGPILWPEHSAWSSARVRQSIIKKTLLQREGEPDDIAKAVAFFFMNAPYVTGQILAVDGGRSIAL